ncbi:hypothetical protein BC828DRAFT_389457 [Blastocladiella britannica]|nr:hypothetical protein BC828DRAFT_389457 [Blastocladiella britannica]
MPMVPFDPNHPPPLPPYGMPGVTHFPVMGPNGRPMLVSARPDGLPPYPAALTSTAASSTLTALGAGSGGDIGSGGARFDDQLDPITTAALAGHERGTSSASTIGDATNAAAAGGAFGPDFGIGAEAWGMSLVTNGSDGFSGDGMSPLSPFSSHRTALHMHQQPPMADQGLQSPPPASMMHSPLHALHLGGGGSNGGCTGVVAASGGNGNGSTSTGGNGGTSTPPASTAAAAAAAAKSIWSPFGPDLFDDIRSAAATTATANAPPSGGPGGTASSAVSSASSSSNNGNGHLASPEGTSAFWGGAGSRVPSGPRSAGLADLFSRSPLDSDLGSIEPAAPATDAFGFAPLGNPSTLSSGGKPLPPTHVGMQAIGSRDHGIAPRLRAASASMPRTATRWSESLSGAIASAAPASSSPAFVSAGATPVSHSRFGPLQPLGPMPASTEPSALLGSRFASIGVMGGGGGSESNDYRR